MRVQVLLLVELAPAVLCACVAFSMHLEHVLAELRLLLEDYDASVCLVAAVFLADEALDALLVGSRDVLS